ncbi:Sulfotransferase family protein [Ruegeria sp. THAF57]|uniref:sulfotransferase family 2 domain-containing protein n=1 Tax=Ruegeria sp. THAF57 TaxID=2744555 RepID=UPI0017542D4A|nr:sulfotransferase family 2 domain-containing protein [Ruegeria sp. THAF57]CAD0183323.1 Sulfotransferase family protein [Ruegeria sp. THAF57]
MIICHSYKFVFIKTMKTAGTSLEVALARACGPEDIISRIVPPEPELNQMPWLNFRNAKIPDRRSGKPRVIRQHSGLKSAISILGSKIRDYRIITSERNPWEKMVSSFYWKLHQTPEQVLEPDQTLEALGPTEMQGLFRKFVLSPVKDPCEAFHMYSHQWVPLIDNLIRYECIEEDLSRVAKSLGLPVSVKLSDVRSKSGIRPQKTNVNLTFDNEMDNAVRLRFAREIANFGYTSSTASAPLYQPPDWREVWRSAAFR